jgi:ADP-ribose pyrophosphatase
MDVETWAGLERSADKKEEVICKSAWMHFIKNELTIDGECFERYVLHHCGAVAALPMTPKGFFLLERQYRFALDQVTIEVPAGRLDPGEEPQAAMQRELQEEIGYTAAHLEPVGLYYPSPGYTNEKVHLFIAKNLIPKSLPSDRGEVIDCIEVEPNQALEMVRSGEIIDGKTQLLITKFMILFMNGDQSSQ